MGKHSTKGGKHRGSPPPPPPPPPPSTTDTLNSKYTLDPVTFKEVPRNG